MNSRSCPSPRRSLKACAPRFLQSLQVWDENQFRIFECRVDGYPRPDIRWEKSGNPIGKSRRIHMTRCGDKCLLQIRMPQIEDMGIYSCIATNIVGTATTQFKVGASGVQKMNSTSNHKLVPPEKESVRSRLRSQSGPRKSDQDASKNKVSNFTSHIWKRNNNTEQLQQVDTHQQKHEIRIDVSKKQLSKSMDDCRRNKRSFLNRVKIPDIFSAQRTEDEDKKPQIEREKISDEIHCTNGEISIIVQNSKNIVKTSSGVDGEKQNKSDAKTGRSIVDESPIQLSTRERIAAYLKRFENPPRTTKIKEPPQEIKHVKSKETPTENGRTLKRNLSNDKKTLATVEQKHSEQTESDSGFFNFNKFMRRKSSDGGKKEKKCLIREVSLDLEGKSDHEEETNFINCLTVKLNEQLNPENTSDSLNADLQHNVPNDEVIKNDDETIDLIMENLKKVTPIKTEAQIIEKNAIVESKPTTLTVEHNEEDNSFFSFSRFLRRKSSDGSKKSNLENVGSESNLTNQDNKINDSLRCAIPVVDTLNNSENVSKIDVSKCDSINETNDEKIKKAGKNLPSDESVQKQNGKRTVTKGLEHKNSDRNEGESSFFSLSKFMRRKSSDNSRRNSNCENQLGDNVLDPDHKEKESEDEVTHNSNSVDLGTFESIDTDLSDNIQNLEKTPEKPPEVVEHPANDGSSIDSPTTNALQSSSEGDEVWREAAIPLIHIEQSAEDSEDSIKLTEDDVVEEVATCSDPVENNVGEQILSNQAIFRKPFTGKIKYSSPVIEEECEELPDELSRPLTPKTDLQRVSSPVECPARIIKGPQSVTVLRGESVTLAICFSGHPPPDVTWMKGHLPQSAWSTVEKISFRSNSTAKIIFSRFFTYAEKNLKMAIAIRKMENFLMWI
ncbi:myosin light chain kinase, smooth muscle [Caerostris extrusa]|uniref:Myosin light chain kinase, smooth muscle n=1 Tax=Caerostris extrusa TaxID=172846 RepID=A0AAV4XSB8_CAEEX|nr:myosin light chain kinase, smooth muscle [Caerostris extrusa]